ncbi:MAG: SDR family oxidoreductase [Clostridiales Family XIII bacterium]|jgi:NAD(P)-dependent dehydrogenase (short-subunit alcohol dehydrogenase family)|nr:SDR family oxidoreductase [Clostridiales Family XIII bacterium]
MVITAEPIKNMQAAFEIKGANVIITGGNRGIGRGILEAFVQSGANVAIVCRNVESGQKTAAEVTEKYGGDHIAVKCDISSLENVKTAVAEIYDHYGHIEVLINNAGVAASGSFLDLDDTMSGWHRVINTDLSGTAQMTFEVAKRMSEAGKGGEIITISSVGGSTAGTTPDHPKTSYHAAKAGVDHMTRALAIELGNYGIRVNAVSPGPTHSDLDADLPQAAIDRVQTRMPMHRFGEPLEVGALCVFLSSPAAVHITGSVIMHDGGYLQII